MNIIVASLFEFLISSQFFVGTGFGKVWIDLHKNNIGLDEELVLNVALGDLIRACCISSLQLVEVIFLCNY